MWAWDVFKSDISGSLPRPPGIRSYENRRNWAICSAVLHIFLARFILLPNLKVMTEKLGRVSLTVSNPWPFQSFHFIPRSIRKKWTQRKVPRLGAKISIPTHMHGWFEFASFEPKIPNWVWNTSIGRTGRACERREGTLFRVSTSFLGGERVV